MSSPPTSHRPTPRRVPFPIHDDPNESAHAATSWLNAQLPPDHFLAQRAPLEQPLLQQIASSVSSSIREWQRGARPDTTSLAAADYDVAVSTGFLPPEEPVQRLTIGAGWDQFEIALDRAQRELKGSQGGGIGRLGQGWRKRVEQLPSASVIALTTLPLLRRAHVVLSYLAHFYTHSIYPYDTKVPASVAIPWVRVSDALGLPPILTYADTVLWNWHLIDPSLGIRADNLAITTTFTSTSSEKAFFFLSLLCELHGPTLLRLMSATLDEAFFADQVALRRISQHLDLMSTTIDDLTFLLDEATRGPFGPAPVRTTITPSVFYWEIRPWFNGGKWEYEGVGELEYGGPSAGQSSLIHAIDLFLGIDHSPRAASTSTASSSQVMDPSAHLSPPTSAETKVLSDETFMTRMSTYMPGHHRSFLRHLAALHEPENGRAALPSIRTLVARHPTQLGSAYDRAVGAMKRFRDEHMKLATVFIVSQARREPGRETVFWDEWEAKRIEKEKSNDGRDLMKGTGGTDLVVFLKMCRDRTKEALTTPP